MKQMVTQLMTIHFHSANFKQYTVIHLVVGALAAISLLILLPTEGHAEYYTLVFFQYTRTRIKSSFSTAFSYRNRTKL